MTAFDLEKQSLWESTCILVVFTTGYCNLVTTCRIIVEFSVASKQTSIQSLRRDTVSLPVMNEFTKVGRICQTRYSFPAPATICITTNNAMTHQYLLKLLEFRNPMNRLNLLLQESFLILLFCLWYFSIRIQYNGFVKDRLRSGIWWDHFHLKLILLFALPWYFKRTQ